MRNKKQPTSEPSTAIEAYKRLQKSLNRASQVSVVTGERVPLGEIDFLDAGHSLMLRTAIEIAFSEISTVERAICTSKVPGKNYFVFKKATSSESFVSRPVNEALFSDDLESVRLLFDTLDAGFSPDDLRRRLNSWSVELLQKTLYSMTIAFCCAIDIQKSGDRKTPGTFFEYVVAYMFSRRLRINPVRRVEITSQGTKISLPTDFIFDPGPQHRKFHVPAKTSTRERIIQVWAHQRVIDGTLGQGRFLGTPVIMTETKLDKEKLEVIEICLPLQWQIYQAHISQLTRIYYLDVPQPYVALNDVMPPIKVRPFAEFFLESESLV